MKGLFLRLEPRIDRQLERVCRLEGYKKGGLIRKLILDFVHHRNTSDPVREAREFGIDLSLLKANLRKSPTERLRDHAQAERFAEQLRRQGRQPIAEPPLGGSQISSQNTKEWQTGSLRRAGMRRK